MNSLTITILAIILSTLIAGFVRRNAKDKCIKDFKNNNITLLTIDNKYVTGRMIVEGTGLEFVFTNNQSEKAKSGKRTDNAKQKARHDDSENSDDTQTLGECDENNEDAREDSANLAEVVEAGKGLACEKSGKLYSYILYKTEFVRIAALIRYHKNLSEKDKIARKKDIDRTYHPSRLRRLKRRFMNMLKMLKDAMMEIFTVLTGHISTKPNISQRITATEINQTTKIQKELVNVIDAAYDPLLEKYIGNLVILEFNFNNTLHTFKGILKEYTSEFIELLDILIKTEYDDEATSADIIVPRKLAVIRGVGEKAEKSWIKKLEVKSQ